MRLNPHAVLGVSPEASADEIKQAYRRLAQLWHPDRHATDPTRQHDAQERFKDITAAYAELTRPTRRRYAPSEASSSPSPRGPGAKTGPQWGQTGETGRAGGGASGWPHAGRQGDAGAGWPRPGPQRQAAAGWPPSGRTGGPASGWPQTGRAGSRTPPWPGAGQQQGWPPPPWPPRGPPSGGPPPWARRPAGGAGGGTGASARQTVGGRLRMVALLFGLALATRGQGISAVFLFFASMSGAFLAADLFTSLRDVRRWLVLTVLLFLATRGDLPELRQFSWAGLTVIAVRWLKSR